MSAARTRPDSASQARAAAIEEAARVAERDAEAAAELAEAELDDDVRDHHLARKLACEGVAKAIRALAGKP